MMIGYGKGEIEPKIAPLVEAVRAAGFDTFSSCEGHLTDTSDGFPRHATVAFYASEVDAKAVHSALVNYRERLACSWVLCAVFVVHRDTRDWVLGWNIENCGIIEPGEDSDFDRRTLEAGWQDIPSLIEMFHELQHTRGTPTQRP